MTSEEVRVHRHRPKDRRAQIAATSAAAFAELGYHQVSITDIGARLGITSAALYRHYPSKYAIFAAELFRLAEVTVAAVTLPPQAQQWTPQRRLGHALEAIVAGTIANRPTVALARREARYLDPPDRATLDDRFATATAMLSELVAGGAPRAVGARVRGARHRNVQRGQQHRRPSGGAVGEIDFRTAGFAVLGDRRDGSARAGFDLGSPGHGGRVAAQA
ncbi:helix-turn-helix domain-containing protein [Nocardia sp. NPDC052001]|uniref:TetR/AcrR family transcriptional regulator n=1 Tax=Nocardia sp. NPDC052001 TaxID=3154853 RepID=UPI00342A7F2D